LTESVKEQLNSNLITLMCKFKKAAHIQFCVDEEVNVLGSAFVMSSQERINDLEAQKKRMEEEIQKLREELVLEK